MNTNRSQTIALQTDRAQANRKSASKKMVRAAAVAGMAAGACTLAAAQSSVTLYGTIDASVYSKQLSGEKRLSTLNSGNLNSSRFGFRGIEDLGGGMRARFDLSGFLRLDTGAAGRNDTDPFWGRWAWVGLESNAGFLRLGRISAPTYVNSIRFNPFYDGPIAPVLMHIYQPSAAQPMMTSQGAADSAWSNSVNYTTPDLGGLEVQLQAAAGEGTTAGRRLGGSVYYTSGPFAIGLAADDISKAGLNYSKPPASVPIQDAGTVQLGASYDFKVLKLFAQAQRTKLENTSVDIKLQTTQLGATIPVSVAGRVLTSWAHTVKEQTAIADVKRDTFHIGYDHNLSKRTDVYALVISDKVTNLNRGTGYMAGIRHNF